MHDGNDEPLVSCLCVTRGKPDKLRRAIDCFLAQTYECRQLVIVFEDDDFPTRRVVKEVESRFPRHVVSMEVPARPKLTLGQLRNVAVSLADGEYFCQWDDDDWYHDQRVANQLAAARSSGRPACLLTNWLIFDEIKRQAYFSHFRLWEGTILCRRDVLDEQLRYPSLPRAEDYLFTNLLVERGHVFPLAAAGMYIYTVHTKNTWSRDHFETMFSCSQRLSSEATMLIEDILNGRYSVADASRLLRSGRVLNQLSYFPGQPVAFPFLGQSQTGSVQTMEAIRAAGG